MKQFEIKSHDGPGRYGKLGDMETPMIINKDDFNIAKDESSAYDVEREIAEWSVNQTIEKAKQGAYVAKATSMLQKVRNDKGELNGIYFVNGIAYSGPYNEVLAKLINSDSTLLLRDFTLSIGVVSNHGNWFTSGNQNSHFENLA